MAVSRAFQGPEFLIELEYDAIKNHELGECLSRPKPDSDDTIDESLTNLQAGAETGRGSYLSLVLTTIQAIEPNATLFVWHANFHPGLARRFQSAVISCKFSIQPTNPVDSAPSAIPVLSTPPLKIIAHAPRRSFGGVVKESKTISWSREMPLSINAGVARVGIKPSFSQEASNEVEHAFTITGTARGVPQKTTCVWTIEENSASECGIPSEIRLATLLQHASPVLCDVNVSARTSGGLLPLHYLRAKTRPEERRKEIDPSKYAGTLFEYDLKEGIKECEKLLETWTGEVENAVLRFAQPVVRP